MPQFFAWTEGNNTDAAYVRFDDDDLTAEPVVVTVYGTERAPNHPFALGFMPALITAGKARLISEAEATALVTHPRGAA